MPSRSPLHAVPPEILATIAHSLATDHPFLPPRDLCALRATCRHLRDALNAHYNPALWATAFAFRFDAGPVKRRNFRPNGRDYFDQLRQYTDTLDAIRSGNISHPDIGDVFRIVYVMLLDNDGKNRTQLEAAGVDNFIDTYIRTRLWSEAHLRDGWPDDASTHSFAVWIKWMLTTPEQLQNESTSAREEMVALVLPYVLNPYRYAQAEAPPYHFHFPLPLHKSTNLIPHSFPSAHGPYPVYTPNAEVSYPYFGSLPYFSPPPIAIAAKLLYFARREILPFNIPHHIPATRAQALPSSEPSPTQEDFIEFNAHRGAKPPDRVTWDWYSGTRLVNGVFDPATVANPASEVWDVDYWRRRLCGNAWKRQPKWRPAKVYVPGSMDGLWQGRLVFPMQDALHQLIQQAVYPQHNFNELSLRVIHQPLFMRLVEHHSVDPDIPIPFPEQNSNDEDEEDEDLSMKNAWFPGLPGHLDFSSYGNEKKTFVSINGQDNPTWIYTNFTRDHDHEEEEEHEGHEKCEMCKERRELYRRAMELDKEDLDGLNGVYESRWEEIEGRMFGSVGLSRDESAPMDEDDDHDDEEDDGDGDVEIEDADAEDENDVDVEIEDVDIEDETENENEEEIEFIEDPNADIQNQKPSTSSFMSPVRRGTDRTKIEKCNGIKDIIFSGSTDKKHAQAWNQFTFYGRLRPWDGLIGILRRAYWPTQSLLFFYGYLVGGERFVGNWRFAAVDPRSPTWESAFVMSRREEGRE
ncbi:hypothetical protein Agabi119p4_1088 [Agaricus bisporus var. burnettii]|uniref:F-box domain-containing protein n=1 Tax=Agaricus bisporus var. burnettii TaxID=192524 RepID=A0A8H7FCB5_AGABI|nr:hypothetical protein Agabi119p4_1088 [Agaricus bisporus var. burnettii]